MMSASFGMRGLEGMKHVCHEKHHAKLNLYCKVAFFKTFRSEALVKLLVDISASVFGKHLIISQSDQSYTPRFITDLLCGSYIMKGTY